jgi:hypothetical protein
MKTIAHLALPAVIALFAIAPACQAAGGRATATISQIEDLERAKMDKEDSKRRREQREMEDDLNAEQGDNPNCGTVSIGNGNSNSNQTGVGRVVPGNTTVIVNGNVYNTASCGH